MTPKRNLAKVDALTIIVMGSDGHAYVLKRIRGSAHVSLAELARWAEHRIWILQDVPTREENLMRSLNESYERYLSCKTLQFELSADQWLTTSDALAGRISHLIERGHDVPNAVLVYLDKPPPEYACTRNRG